MGFAVDKQAHPSTNVHIRRSKHLLFKYMDKGIVVECLYDQMKANSVQVREREKVRNVLYGERGNNMSCVQGQVKKNKKQTCKAICSAYSC